MRLRLALASVVVLGGAWLIFDFVSAEAEPAPSAGTPAPAAENRPTARVAALGRLEPEGRIRRLAGPSDLVVVVKTLDVERGERVEAGQRIGTLDTLDVAAAAMAAAEAAVDSAEAAIERVAAALANARREAERSRRLRGENVVAEADLDRWTTEVAVLEAERRALEADLRTKRADVAERRAELERSYLYSPIDGQVLEIHAHPGERVGEEGILELARTQRMVAVAEVYESDVARVKVGQRARVTSPALPKELGGVVSWVGLKVAKQDALGTDPAARKDARVVEVEVLLDDSEPAATLTNLQVEVVIEAGRESR